MGFCFQVVSAGWMTFDKGANFCYRFDLFSLKLSCLMSVVKFSQCSLAVLFVEACSVMAIYPMRPQRPWLPYILLLYILINQSGAISPDGEALLSFRNAIVSSDGILPLWRPEDADPCKWRGVKCDPKTKRVIYLSLKNHKISGPISPDLGMLAHLKVLALNNNSFYGTIPSELGNCTELQGIFLQGNYLSGPIPSEMGNLTALQNLNNPDVIHLCLSQFLKGYDRFAVGLQCAVSSVDMYTSPSIGFFLLQMKLIRYFYRDISSNSLSGSIPSSLGRLNKLITFNVSNNFLVGPIPSDGVLINFADNSFTGNRDLCGKQIDRTCKDGSGVPGTDGQSPSGQNQEGKKKYSGGLLISTSATIGALLLVALMCFWGCFLYKKFGKNGSNSIAMDVCGGASIVMFHGDLPYSSKDIIKKLETLTEEDVIGSGGFGTVYKLEMDDGNIFALKRIVKIDEGFNRFFERELEILGSIKHRYLVNLRGYCNSPMSKLLIYDFLSGGSLDEALHGDEESHITTIVAGTFGYLAPGKQCTCSGTYATDLTKLLNFLITENRPREIVDLNCEGVQLESLDALLSVATQCVSSSPEDRPTMHRVVQVLESEMYHNSLIEEHTISSGSLGTKLIAHRLEFSCPRLAWMGGTRAIGFVPGFDLPLVSPFGTPVTELSMSEGVAPGIASCLKWIALAACDHHAAPLIWNSLTFRNYFSLTVPAWLYLKYD
ncbi:hypothetical protein SADUNF_Sadunf01G0103900 [Salix dunnii]|uniref:Protein kinase domain-containing protein n=1 Tax=Salix dunnii TaxID=1413687 RepID=A0A835TK17_9ROSI|nr:hypothetical protein SADUNF_Sadunf01G0103900 [Salix dunnii]